MLAMRATTYVAGSIGRIALFSSDSWQATKRRRTQPERNLKLMSLNQRRNDATTLANYRTSVIPPSTTSICPVAYRVLSNPSVASTQSSGVAERLSGAMVFTFS